MNYYALLINDPSSFTIALFNSLFITVLVYSAFPIVFALSRNALITKKKYRGLCYGLNAIGMVLFIVLNGASSGAPYAIWTLVFSSCGLKILNAKGVLLSSEQLEKSLRLKTEMEEEAKKVGKTLEAYIEEKYSPSLLQFCEGNRGNALALKERLFEHDVEAGVLSQAEALFLLELYTRKNKTRKKEQPEAFPLNESTKGQSIYNKVLSFFKSTKKLFIILFIVSIALLIISLIGYAIFNVMATNARLHYQNTFTTEPNYYYNESYFKFFVGCGHLSCDYCHGKMVESYHVQNYYWETFSFNKTCQTHFPYYSNAITVRDILESCANIFLICSIVFLSIILIRLFVIKILPKIEVKIKSKIKQKQSEKATQPNDAPINTDPTQKKQINFCKYCGTKIDSDSVFCSFCGKKLL